MNHHPKTRDEILVEQLEAIIAKRQRTCIKCDHWAPQLESCEKHCARPPISVIVYGCDDFSEEIPF